MIILRFREYADGFVLENPECEREEALIGFYSYNPFSAQADAHPETKEIVYFSLVFYYPDIEPIEQLETEINYADEIPGLYTVPELGVKNATFKEVLEAVKKYYEAKLSQKPVQTA